MRGESAVVHTVYSGFFNFPSLGQALAILFLCFGTCYNPILTWNTYAQGKTTIKEKVRKGRKAPAWMLFYWNTTLSQKGWNLSPEKVKSIRLKVCKTQIGFCIFSSRRSADIQEKKTNIMGQHFRLIHNSKLTHDAWKDSYENSHMYQVDIIKASPAQIPKHWSALIGFLCCRGTRETIFSTDDKHWQFYLFI